MMVHAGDISQSSHGQYVMEPGCGNKHKEKITFESIWLFITPSFGLLQKSHTRVFRSRWYQNEARPQPIVLADANLGVIFTYNSLITKPAL